MATQAFPPTPAQSPEAKPNPVGSAVAGGQPQMKQLVTQAASGLQALRMLAKALEQVKPEAAQKFNEGLTSIQQGISLLQGGGAPGPTAPQGSVPAPPQMAAQSPEQTPEAT